MQIIIVGCGKVGRALVAQLSEENNNITVVDTDPDTVRNVSTMYDVMGIVGNGASYSVLKGADLEHTDILIATTEKDEVNLLCCIIARRKADCNTICRLRNPAYYEEHSFLRGELQLSMIINPDLEAAREIARLLRFPNAIEIDTFANERIDLLRFRVPTGSMLIGQSLKDSTQRIQQDALVCMVERNGEITIPRGDYVIEEEDILTIIAMPWEAEKYFQEIGVKTNRANNVIIVGGGSMTYYLTRILLRSGVDVKIIEQKMRRCEQLGDEFPDAIVECADGSDKAVLQEERLDSTDALVATTGIDEVNVILSKYAQGKVRKKVVTKLNHIDFDEVIESLGLDSVIMPKELTAERILQYVRAMAAGMDSNVETLYRLMNNRVEALEFVIRPQTRIADIPLSEMKLKSNTLIAGILRDGTLIIPSGQDCFREGDVVVVITSHLGFKDIYDILQGNGK